MFACSRFFTRTTSSVLFKEISSNFRNNLYGNFHNFSVISNTTLKSQNSTQLSDSIKNNDTLSNIAVTFCGFPKNLVAGPSCVLGCNVFGDDACFIANYKSVHVAGVADGVGGWRSYGINPSEISSKLMKNCSEIVEEGDFEPSRPDLLIGKAFNCLKSKPKLIGSSTACIIIIYQKILYSANLGDSGYLVYRDKKIIHRSKEQTHYFNAPFQLTVLPEEFELEGIIMDKPENSELDKIKLESGDIVVLATDGLWDNVPENLILETLNNVKSEDLQATCNSIALIARRLSHDESYPSPFAVKASYHGIKTVGGKPDDITLVLLYVS